MRLLVGEELANAVEFVQQLLEPELVHLMDDDEQQLVVLRPLRARLLQRQQLIDFQVAGIRDGWIGHEISPDWRRAPSYASKRGCRNASDTTQLSYADEAGHHGLV